MHPKQRSRFPGRLRPAKTAPCTAPSAHQPDPGHRHPCCCASPHAAKRASRGPASSERAATIPIAISGHRFSPTRFWLTGAASATEGQLRRSCAAPPGDRAGWPSSRERRKFRTPTGLRTRKAIRGAALSRGASRSGVVGDPSMHGRSLPGNRDISPPTGGVAHRRPAPGRPYGRSRR